MRRFVLFVVFLVLSAGAVLAQKPTEKAGEKREPQFEPAGVAVAADVDYPIKSIAEGTVVLQVTVKTAGEAEEVKVLRGVPSLTEEALRSIKKWKFTAAKLDGKPIRSTVPVVFVFTRPVIP